MLQKIKIAANVYFYKLFVNCVCNNVFLYVLWLWEEQGGPNNKKNEILRIFEIFTL